MILGIGDCNMGGAERFKGKTYLEIVGEKLGIKVKNRAITMSTTREGKIIFREERDPEIVVIAFGLVDSWKTFKYAPYVLYYPDNVLRKIARKFVKKYKKIARKLGLNKKLGEKYVVEPEEFVANLHEMVSSSKRVVLVETPPHLRQKFRNEDIKKYNALMHKVARCYPHCNVIKIYEDIERQHYLDDIHFSQKGHEFVAKRILETL